MTSQQDGQNTFSIQHIFTANSEESMLFLQLNTASFYCLHNLSLETNGPKSFYRKLSKPPILNPEIVNKIATRLGLVYTVEKEIPEGAVCFANSPEVRPGFRLTFAATDIFDYIYAVLHSRDYRNKYKEFLKIDFPELPYPKNTTAFWQLVKLGSALKQTHLSALIETGRIMKEIDKV